MSQCMIYPKWDLLAMPVSSCIICQRDVCLHKLFLLLRRQSKGVTASLKLGHCSHLNTSLKESRAIALVASEHKNTCLANGVYHRYLIYRAFFFFLGFCCPFYSTLYHFFVITFLEIRSGQAWNLKNIKRLLLLPGPMEALVLVSARDW